MHIARPHGIVESASGARLYVMGPLAKAAQANEVLLIALSMLPETDVDRENAAVFAEWGGESQLGHVARHGLPKQT